MTIRTGVSAPPRSAARFAIAGVALAVMALSGVAVWSAYVSQSAAADLSDVGVQTTGQLQATQALYVIRVETEELQDDFSDEGLARLRQALRILPEALQRMTSGEAPEPIAVAAQARPLAQQLDVAIDRFLSDPQGDILCECSDGDDTAEDAAEAVVEDLEKLLSDSGSDPARLLGDKLDTVQDAGQAVRRIALILTPLGLGGVLACGWLLRSHRRRFETAMKAAAQSNARDARTDQLTDLPNRRALLEELERRIATGENFTIAMADLNGFKHYNDTYGHPEGDALLRRLGHELARAWQGHGFAARLGGDEFCVLTDDLAPDRISNRLHHALSETGADYSISAVSGLATVPTEAADANSALSLADSRLYAAKEEFYTTAATRGRRARSPHIVEHSVSAPAEDSRLTA